MAESLAQLKKKMRDVLGKMQKKYGVVKLGNSRGDIEQCVFLILREGWDFRKAAKAVKILQEVFVDWNEVRVSSVREIKEAVRFLKYQDLDDKIERVKNMFQEVFHEFNRLNLDFLLEADFEETRSAFLELEALGRSNAYIILQCLQDMIDVAEEKDSQTLVMSTEALRVGTRLGLIKKTSSHNVGRKEFGKLIKPQDNILIQHLFVRHGETFCTSKSPLCKECFLRNICKYYQS
jgi:endonuclease-3